jgi:hypothetical protein
VDGRKYVSDSCLKFIEVVRVVAGLVLVALHPIGLDLISRLLVMSILIPANRARMVNLSPQICGRRVKPMVKGL